MVLEAVASSPMRKKEELLWLRVESDLLLLFVLPS